MSAVHGLLARPLSSYSLLLASSGMILLIGLTMVLSATSVQSYAKDGSAFSGLAKQGTFALLGLLAFWLFQRISTDALRALSKIILGTSIILLATLGALIALVNSGILAAPKIGPIKADLLWLYIGSVGIQPSEFAKLGLVLWCADLFARKGRNLARWRELSIPLFPIMGLLFLLVGYNDLGTMLVILILIVGLLWSAGINIRVFAALGVIALSGIAILIAAASIGAGSGSTNAANYRQGRLETFFTPLEKCDIANECYQIMQARSAIFEGGWFGSGLGEGALKWNWLPEADNDFIFAVIAEELGVVGCMVILILFCVLSYVGFRIARRSADPFRRYAATGVTTWIAGQAMINMGGVVGLLPITGLPLPFISTGGSALVVAMAGVGVLASCARAEPDAARALNSRSTTRWSRILWAPLPPRPFHDR